MDTTTATTEDLFVIRDRVGQELERRAMHVLLALGVDEEEAKFVTSVHETKSRDNKPLVTIKYGNHTEEYQWVPAATFALLAKECTP